MLTPDEREALGTVLAYAATLGALYPGQDRVAIHRATSDDPALERTLDLRDLRLLTSAVSRLSVDLGQPCQVAHDPVEDADWCYAHGNFASVCAEALDDAAEAAWAAFTGDESVEFKAKEPWTRERWREVARAAWGER